MIIFQLNSGYPATARLYRVVYDIGTSTFLLAKKTLFLTYETSKGYYSS